MPPLVLSMGDPAGCGPQITAATWHALRAVPQACFAIIADPALFAGRAPVTVISDLAEASAAFAAGLPVLPLETPLPQSVTPGTPDPAFAEAITTSIARGVALCQSGAARALVTNPISKAVLYAAGFPHPGHTEYLAQLCAPPGEHPEQPIMMLVGGGLRVALATIHMPLMQVGAVLTTDLLVTTGKIVAAALKRDFGLPSPRLAFTGLNPHAGENGSLGREEIEIINPAAEQLRGAGIDIANALSADTVFHQALDGQFDAIIAMTHDQGLIPVKTLDMWGGVNTTLGLPIIRTSPDHGTAYDAAAAGTCRPDSLIAAIKLADEMSTHRTARDD